MGLFNFFKKKESKNLISTDVSTVTTSINKIQEDIVPIEEKIRGKLPNVIKLRNGIFEGNTKNVLLFFL